MKLRRIALDGFRNYTDFTTDFSPGVNVIWGENAQGKTNLLEAIGFLSGARSHRARGDKELISFHRDRGTITAEVTSRGRDFLLEVQLFRGARRRLFVNHVKCKTAAELGGIVQTVLFCPEDLALIKAGAAERRSFLDHAICQLRPRYAEALAQYHKLLDHKTRILRDWEKHPSLLDVLEDFNEAMARAGALVIHYRAHFVRKLAEKAAQIQTEFSGGRRHCPCTTPPSPRSGTPWAPRWSSTRTSAATRTAMPRPSGTPGPVSPAPTRTTWWPGSTASLPGSMPPRGRPGPLRCR